MTSILLYFHSRFDYKLPFVSIKTLVLLTPNFRFCFFEFWDPFYVEVLLSLAATEAFP